MLYAKSNHRSSNEETVPLETNVLSSKGYNLIKQIGKGAYSKVYLTEFIRPNALEDTPAQMCACKVMDIQKLPKDFVNHYLPRELRIISQLRHPHIIHVWSIFRRKTVYYIFMRYAEHGDLCDFIQKQGPLAENKARVWFRQLISAVLYLHDKNIAHRDLKCENILISSNFNLKITDFSFAKCCLQDDTGKYTLSETYCGTTPYAAPELMVGKPYEPLKVDIWSLGVILFVILNRRYPFTEIDSFKKLHNAQMNKQYKFKVARENALSMDVKNLVSCMLEPISKKRYNIQDVASHEWLSSGLLDLKKSK